MSFLILLRQEPRALGFGLLHTVASSAGQTFLIALFLPGIKVSFSLGDAEVANIYGLATVGGAAVLWWIGRWIDRVDVVHYSIASGLLLAFACALIAGAATVPLLAIGLFCLRLGGQGLFTHVAITGVARYFAQARGKALSIISMGYSLGEAILPGVAVVLIGAWGWRPTFVAVGALALLFAAIGGGLVRHNRDFRSPHRPVLPAMPADPAERTMPRQYLRSKYFVATAPLFAAIPLVMTALIFHQAVIAEEKGFTLQLFAFSFVAFALSRIVSSLMVGPAIDRAGSDGLFAMHLVPLCLGIAILAAGSQSWIVPVYWVLAGISSGMSGPLQAAILAEKVPLHGLGAARGIVASITILASAAGPVAYGWLLQEGVAMTGLLSGTAAVLVGATLLGVIVWLGTDQPRRRRASAKAG